jgi:hypothetical protein
MRGNMVSHLAVKLSPLLIVWNITANIIAVWAIIYYVSKTTPAFECIVEQHPIWTLLLPSAISGLVATWTIFKAPRDVILRKGSLGT